MNDRIEQPKVSGLVLAREEEEAIVIDGQIVVSVVHIQPNARRVRLAIRAPEHVTVDRYETHIKRTGQAL